MWYFVRGWIALGAGLGLLLGGARLLAALGGQEVSVRFFSHMWTGTAAGVAGLVVYPLAMGAGFALLGLPVYGLFVVTLRLIAALTK